MRVGRSDGWYFGWSVGLFVVDCFDIFLVGWLVVLLVGGCLVTSCQDTRKSVWREVK